jgi:hypothetical protein
MLRRGGLTQKNQKAKFPGNKIPQTKPPGDFQAAGLEVRTQKIEVPTIQVQS